MARKKALKRKEAVKRFFVYLGKGVWFTLKLPYYYVKGAHKLGKKISEKEEEVKVSRRRKGIGAVHEDFRVVDVMAGDYSVWADSVGGSSQIGIILGARGTGKTAFGVKLLENMYAKSKVKCFAMGFVESEMPAWIRVVSDVEDVENDSVVLIDEGGVLFNSRRSMSGANKLLSSLMMVARHKNISIVFISQNSSNLEVNILRQADFLALKRSSLLQKDFERKIIQKIYSEVSDGFERFSDDEGLVHIYSGRFRGFVSNPLPSFWGEGVSKGFA